MEDNKSMARLFLAGIVISSFIVSPDILDIGLVSRFISLSLFLLLTFFVMYRKKLQITIKADLPFVAYLLYTLFSCSSILWATVTSEALFEGAKLVLGFLVFAFTLFFLRRDSSFMTGFLKYSVVLFFIELVIIAVQFTGLPNLDKLSLYHITGLNAHKNLLSSFLLLNLFFLVNAMIKLQKPWKLLAAIATGLTIFLLLFLKTKAVWLGISVAVIMYFLVHLFCIRQPIKLKLNAAVIISAFMLVATIFFLKVLPLIIDKGLHYNQELSLPEKEKEQAELDDERLTLWEKTYTIFEKHAIIGVGMGNWQIEYPDAGLQRLWRAEDLNYTFQRPHNDFLWILSETGIIGFSLWLLAIISMLVFALKAIAATPDKTTAREIALCVAAITGYLTASFFDFPRERMEHIIWINILLAIVYHHTQKQVALKTAPALTPHRLSYLAAAGVLLFFVYLGVLRHQGEFALRSMYAYKNRNKLPETIERCKAAESFAYTIDPTSIPISWYSGNAKAALGDYTAAQKDFIKAYRLNPYNRNVLNDLASSYAYTNQVDLAKAYYQEAARISPRFDDPKLNLAAIYIREENYKMASYWLKAIHHPSERRTNYQKIVDMNLLNP